MTDKRAFFIYFALRLVGVLLFAGGLLALSREQRIVAVLCLVPGLASVFLRPRHLGLTRR